MNDWTSTTDPSGLEAAMAALALYMLRQARVTSGGSKGRIAQNSGGAALPSSGRDIHEIGCMYIRCGNGFRPVMIHDQPGSPLPCQIRPHPLKKNTHAEAGLGKELKMNGRPNHPCQQTTHTNGAALQNSITFADDRHVSLVEIPERPERRLAGQV